MWTIYGLWCEGCFVDRVRKSIGLGLGQNSLLVCYLLALCPLLTIVSWWAKDHRTVFGLEHSIGLGPALSQNSYDVGHIKH